MFCILHFVRLLPSICNKKQLDFGMLGETVSNSPVQHKIRASATDSRLQECPQAKARAGTQHKVRGKLILLRIFNMKI